MDDTSRSSVSSLKSRFEQLATREVKHGPSVEQSSQVGGVIRGCSVDLHRPAEEENPRGSIDGILPVPCLCRTRLMMKMADPLGRNHRNRPLDLKISRG